MTPTEPEKKKLWCECEKPKIWLGDGCQKCGRDVRADIGKPIPQCSTYRITDMLEQAKQESREETFEYIKEKMKEISRRTYSDSNGLYIIDQVEDVLEAAKNGPSEGCSCDTCTLHRKQLKEAVNNNK